MTHSATFGSLHRRTAKSAVALFSHSNIYRFCLGFFILDFVDVLNLVDYSSVAVALKYCYAAVVLGFMVTYFAKWQKVDTSNFAPIISLLFFIATGTAFTLRYMLYNERDGYVSAFISSLLFALAIFIPQNAIRLDLSKVIRQVTNLLALAAVFYLAEALVKPLEVVKSMTYLHEVMFLKSINCVIAIALSLLTGRKALTLILAIVTGIALVLRPTSSLVLALSCCVPLALGLRLGVIGRSRSIVYLAGAGSLAILFLALAIPLLLYFFFDDIGSLINSSEAYLKTDLMGGQSNTSFRLAILKFAFATFDNTSPWYGSALSGSINIPIARQFDWWFTVDQNGTVPIHSDFVIIMVLMGMIGYFLFGLMLYLALRGCFRQLKRSTVRGDVAVIHSIAAVGIIALIIYCSSEPFLSYYNHTHIVWMLLLFSEVARKSSVSVDLKVGSPRARSTLVRGNWKGTLAWKG